MHERYLEHYGVPGMKWGRRKSSGQILIGGPTNQGTNRPGGSSNSNSSSGSKQSSSSGSKKKSRPYVDAKWREVNDDGPSSKSSSAPKPKPESPKPTNSQTSKSVDFDIKGTQTGLKSGKKIAEAGANMLAKERKDRNTKSLKAEAKEMTNDELKAVINRLATEQRYVELMGKEGVREAKSNLETTLETLTTVATIADTALGVYGAIQDVRRMK